MPNSRSIVLACLLISLIAGCQVSIVSSKKLEITYSSPKQTSLPLLNNSYANNVHRSNWNKNSRLELTAKNPDPCRIKYHSSYSINQWMVIEGIIGDNRHYPVILDTGASVPLFVNDIHIRENRLAFVPARSSKYESSGWGKCLIPKLNIGQVTLSNWTSYYKEQHMELKLFGLPLAKGKAVIAGLGTLRRFKYIMFDSINKEVELSLEKTYEPSDREMWATYPFNIEEGLGDNCYLYVRIPVAGEEVELQLDTGSGKGLAVSEEIWEYISKKIRYTKLNESKDLYPYIGLLKCKKSIIPELKFGNRVITNAGISIFPSNSALVEQCSGLVGMQYFKDTIIVLDFERNLLWVRIKHQSITSI